MSGIQGVKVEPQALAKSSWQDYAIRFVFGGLVTVVTGLIAYRYGPVVGGLFLAFPAILPASATLIAQHEGQPASQASTSGAAVGSVALLLFGAAVWLLAGRAPPLLVLLVALLIWAAAAVGLWLLVNGTRSFQDVSGEQ